jgi:putative phosphoesterase
MSFGRPASGGCDELNLAIVSDTHGNSGGLRETVKEILARYKIDLFIHLGDDYDDAKVFEEFGSEYVRVPGVYSGYYGDNSVPNRILRDFGGWRFLLSHTDVSHSNDLPDDPRPEDLVAGGKIDVLLYGHSHEPHIATKDGVLFLNPGHLKEKDKKGGSASYALLDVGRDLIEAKIVEAKSKKTLQEVSFRKT